MSKNMKILLDQKMIEEKAKKNLNQKILLTILCGVLITFMLVIPCIYLLFCRDVDIMSKVLSIIMVATIFLSFLFSAISELKLANIEYKRAKNKKYRIVKEEVKKIAYAKTETGERLKSIMVTLVDADGNERKMSYKTPEFFRTTKGSTYYTVFFDDFDYAFASFSTEKYEIE